MRLSETLLITVLSLGCGGNDVPTRAPDQTQTRAPNPTGPGLSVGGTIGGLDESEVKKVIQKAWSDVSRCMRKGRTRIAFLGGKVGIDITVGSTGRATKVFLSSSTLGDHRVESCIAKAFDSKQWPRPVGGKVGKVAQTFDLEAGHPEPPLDWSASVLKQKMAAEAEPGERPFDDLDKALQLCRKDAGAGPLVVTMYLDEDGLVQSAGVGMADVHGQDAVECVVTTVQTTSFPAPEENFAKVTVSVE